MKGKEKQERLFFSIDMKNLKTLTTEITIHIGFFLIVLCSDVMVSVAHWFMFRDTNSDLGCIAGNPRSSHGVCTGWTGLNTGLNRGC